MNRVKLSVFGFVCLVAMLAVPAGVQAQCSSSGGQLGPCPALIDTNRNGLPDPGSDQPITFTFQPGTSTSQVTIHNPWTDDCEGSEARGNVIMFFQGSTTQSPAVRAKAAASIVYDTAQRSVSGITQTIQVTSYNPGSEPVGFHFSELPSEMNGDALLMDDNHDGAYEHIVATTGGVPSVANNGVMAPKATYFDLSFVGTQGYVSIPWSQANLVGMNGTCALPGGDPQIFVPMVNNHIVIGYPGFLSSPLLFISQLQGQEIPTLAEWGLILLVLSLGFVGWRMLRRRHALA